MRRRTYLLGTTTVATALAGCSGDDGADEETAGGSPTEQEPTTTEASTESQAQPAIDAFGLISEREAYDDLDEDIQEAGAGSPVVFGAEYSVPIDDGVVDYAAAVTIHRDGDQIDQSSFTAEDEATSDGPLQGREAWFEFGAEDWTTGTHTAEFTVEDNHFGGEADPASMEFEVVETTIELSEVSPIDASAQRGTAVDLSVTLTNTGSLEGTADVTFVLDGQTQGTDSVTVGGDDETTYTRTVETADMDVGEYDFAFQLGDQEIAGTMTVEEARPEAAIGEVLIPSPVGQGTSQDGNAFNIDVLNEGDAGDVGYALTFTLTEFGDPWESSVESSDVERFDADEQKEVSLSGQPGVGDEYFAFRLWPAQVRADVTNEGIADGPIEVTLLDAGDPVETKSVDVPAGETVEVEFRLPAPSEEPERLHVQAEAA